MPVADADGKSEQQLTKRRRQLLKRREEEATHAAEQARLADPAPGDTIALEKAIAARPNSSLAWIQAMAFHISTGELAAARALAQRALDTIHFRCDILYSGHLPPGSSSDRQSREPMSNLVSMSRQRIKHMLLGAHWQHVIYRAARATCNTAGPVLIACAACSELYMLRSQATAIQFSEQHMPLDLKFARR